MAEEHTLPSSAAPDEADTARAAATAAISRRRTRQRLLWMARLIILAAVTWGIWRAADRAIAQFRADQLSWDGLQWPWLLASCALYGAGLLPMAIYWHRVLHALHQPSSWFTTIRAYYIGHLGKYVPGKAMVVVLRAALLSSSKVNVKIATVSVFVETLTMMATGAFLALMYLLWFVTEGHVLHQLAYGLLLITLLPTLPPVFRRLVVRMRLVSPAQLESGMLDGYNFSLVAQGWLASSTTWLLLGLSLWASLQAIPFFQPPEHSIQSLTLYVSATALAMVAGFLSLLPGGVFVREWVLDQLLTPHVGVVVSLAGAVLLRLVWLLTEVIISVILYLIGRSQR